VAENNADPLRQLEVARTILTLTDANPAVDASRMRGFDHLGGALLQLGRVGEAQVAFRQGLRLTPAGSRLRAIRLVNLADALLEGPDQGSAHAVELAEVLAEALQTIEQSGDELGSAFVGTAQGRLQIVLGDLDGAAESLNQAADKFRNRPDDNGHVANEIGWATLWFARGQTEKARNTLRVELQECIDRNNRFGRSWLLRHWELVDPEGYPGP
jgi:tetratricopeptide (TPR) repeat protein